MEHTVMLFHGLFKSIHKRMGFCMFANSVLHNVRKNLILHFFNDVGDWIGRMMGLNYLKQYRSIYVQFD